MSNPAIVGGVRAALAANLATQTVVWQQHEGGYDAASGGSPAPVSTSLAILLYEQKATQDDEGTLVETIEGIVIPEDLPLPVRKADCFQHGGRWEVTEINPDPTNSIIEFKARR